MHGCGTHDDMTNNTKSDLEEATCKAGSDPPPCAGAHHKGDPCVGKTRAALVKRMVLLVAPLARNNVRGNVEKSTVGHLLNLKEERRKTFIQLSPVNSTNLQTVITK